MAKVKKIIISKNEDSYDITVNRNHNFFANGMLVHNCEIGLYPKTKDGRSGFQFCNLCTINGKWCKTEHDFLQACRASAIIGTLQAAYTDFTYISPETKEITEREALLGCSITGMMDNPEILLNPDIQKLGVVEIKKKNIEIAKYIGINQAARTTCVKPEGTASCVLGTASGTHPHHAKKYIRNVQANKLEFPVQHFMKINPIAVEESVWSNNNTDMVISFCCDVPSGAIVKNQINAIELLEKVKLTQKNWVECGTNEELNTIPTLRHNVSNTITVKPDEWKAVEEYIFENQNWFAGVSLLPFSGDKDYPQAPFTTVHEPKELVKMYGDASVLGSGLVVDGLRAFNGNLWKACDTVLGYGEKLPSAMIEHQYPTKRNNKELAEYFIAKQSYEEWFNKVDWVRRVKQFAERYFNFDHEKCKKLLKSNEEYERMINMHESGFTVEGITEIRQTVSDIKSELVAVRENLRTATYCLKDVSNWKRWCDLKREYKEIDWSTVIEETETHMDVTQNAATACAGGKCTLVF